LKSLNHIPLYFIARHGAHDVCIPWTQKTVMPKRTVDEFITHWSGATAPEQSISQQFLCELCDVLDVQQPDNKRNGSYTFEFHVSESQHDGETKEGRIDLYKRACFVLESKKFQEAISEPTDLELSAEKMGAIPKRKKSAAPVRNTERWDDAMLKALVQAERYTRALPAEEPYPPFVLVVDVGHVIEIRADFSLTGRAYQPFPDPLSYRIRLEQLRDERIRERLKCIWTNPPELDPSKRSAEVTRDVANYLGELAKSFEKQGHAPKAVAEFLTRCLFCMFAEDVGLLPNGEGKPGFSALLNELNPSGEGFVEMLRTLFKEMNEGRKNEISVVLRRKLLKFNGGLFADDTVLPVNGTQLGILKKAASLDWKHVEPAIFGTLLERALGGEGERHKLGAHFTPRAYVERLVLPTVVEPLRAEWDNVRAAAYALAKRATTRSAKVVELMADVQRTQSTGDYAAAKASYKLVQAEKKNASADFEKARNEINSFHERLCNVKVLDPACGSGNFLYVALEHLKRLEGEVLIAAADFGENFKLGLERQTVDPHQFLGLEINPRAVALAELVLWIGYLQWHFRTRGQIMPAEPVLKNFKNIQCRDAVLAYDGEPQPARDKAGNVITTWDRESTKTDPASGQEVPDESKRVPLLDYTNPRPAVWPQADFIVGNPPFTGARTIRPGLNDGYLRSLRAAYPRVPENANFVMYWWHNASELVRAGKTKRFGLITTSTLRQSFNRVVVDAQMSSTPPLSLSFAIPNHPWVDTADGAAVRIAMTVGIAGHHFGDLFRVKHEESKDDGSANVSFESTRGKITAELRIGAEVTKAQALKSNYPFCSVGYQLTGKGFVLSSDDKDALARKDNVPPGEVFHPLLSARDITQKSRKLWAIDLYGKPAEFVRQTLPSVYQHILVWVKKNRDANTDSASNKAWWLFARPRGEFRPALAGLKRMIVSPLTAKHRTFSFSDVKTVADSSTVMFALDDAFHLGVLSSKIHVIFALAPEARLGKGNDPRYIKTNCFDPFPFPLCSEEDKKTIRTIAEELDAHRKRVQAKHGLTLTGLYNVLEKLRAGEKLTGKEKVIHDHGFVSVLKQLHDDLDSAAFSAYRWPLTLTEAEILDRLVALNAERATEEKHGVIHWLRPEYQSGAQKPLNLTETKRAKKPKAAPAKRKRKTLWPKALAERVQAVEAALRAAGGPITPADLAKQFARANPANIAEILKALETLGRANRAGEGKFRP
jgi:hypothetical protein